MGHNARDFWRSGMLDFQQLKEVWLKQNGKDVETIDEIKLDDMYNGAAEVLKKHNKIH